MSNVFANPKLFAAATLLFAVATFANLSMGSSEPASPMMARPAGAPVVLDASAR